MFSTILITSKILRKRSEFSNFKVRFVKIEPKQVIYNSDITLYGSAFRVVKHNIKTVSQEIHNCIIIFPIKPMSF